MLLLLLSNSFQGQLQTDGFCLFMKFHQGGSATSWDTLFISCYGGRLAQKFGADRKRPIKGFSLLFFQTHIDRQVQKIATQKVLFSVPFLDQIVQKMAPKMVLFLVQCGLKISARTSLFLSTIAL